MEDMDEYMRCLDEIGKCNHILALDELTDRNTNSEPKREESKVDDHVQESQLGGQNGTSSGLGPCHLVWQVKKLRARRQSSFTRRVNRRVSVFRCYSLWPLSLCSCRTRRQGAPRRADLCIKDRARPVVARIHTE